MAKVEAGTTVVDQLKKPKMKRLSVQPEPPLPVQWFPKGSPRDTPVPALVLEKQGSDRVLLLVFKSTGGGVAPTPVSDVPHMSDPILTTKKVLMGAEPISAWDFCPDCVPDRFKKINSMYARIVLLHHLHHYDPGQIARSIGGGWNQRLVEGVLEQHASGNVPMEPAK